MRPRPGERVAVEVRSVTSRVCRGRPRDASFWAMVVSRSVPEDQSTRSAEVDGRPELSDEVGGVAKAALVIVVMARRSTRLRKCRPFTKAEVDPGELSGAGVVSVIIAIRFTKVPPGRMISELIWLVSIEVFCRCKFL